MDTYRSVAPQGSIAGPLFFSIFFINDIVQVSSKFAVVLYANVGKQGTGKWATNDKNR